MPTQRGTNLTGIKEKNRALALQLISTGKSVSRANLARSMHLTKTTLGNIVSDLIANDIIREYSSASSEADSSLGRKPITLDLSPSSPLIMGILIKRNLFSAILADLKGHITDQIDYEYDRMDTDLLVQTLVDLYTKLRERQKDRRILAIGISSLGPVDTRSQKLANPTNHTHSDNLLYLHIMNGIGAGYILHGNVYDGDYGQGGELGHTSINFAGPPCTCGNNGCLELYANTGSMNQRIRELRTIYKGPTLMARMPEPYSWNDIIRAASAMDFLAMAALDEFCGYLAYALRNTIHMLDIRHIIVGYDAPAGTSIIEDTLATKLNTNLLSGSEHPIRITKSSFGGQGPLVGSIAVVTDKLFCGELNLY